MANVEPLDPAFGASPRGGLLRWHGGELDLRAAQVRRGGVGVALDRSSYEVLLALLLRAGQVLGKDELLEAAWPGRVVSENSLAKAISRLRRDLGDAAAPLQSVHGYGYRWTGDVQWVELDRPPAVENGPGPVASLVFEDGALVPHRKGWRFRRELGRSAERVVMLVESDHGEAPRALKLGLGEAGLRRVRREVARHRHLAALGHEVAGVAPALGWQLDEPPVFIECPYFEEGDLRRWMATRAGGMPPTLELRLSLVAQIADALGELHAAGVVHEDLWPGNVFLLADPSRPEGWRAVLGDLGGAAAMALPEQARDRGAPPSDVSPERLRADEALYRAPELLSGGVPTQKSDLYALGVLLYQMVVGDLRRPLAPGWEADVDDPLLREDIRGLAALRETDRRPGAAALAQQLRELPARHLARREADAASEQRRRVEVELKQERARLRLVKAVAASLLAGLGIASWTGWLAIDARGDEARRREEAQAVLDFLTDDVLTRADPYQGGARDVSLRAALDDASRMIDGRLGGSPHTAIAVHEAVAGAYEEWGEYSKASVHRRRALELLPAAGRLAGAEIAERQRRLCAVDREAGALEEAAAACESAAELEVREDGDLSEATRIELAKLSFERGDCASAVTSLEALAGRELPGGEADSFRAEARRTIARCQSRGGEEGAAIEAFRALMREQQVRHGETHPATASALADYVDALIRAGRLVEAEVGLDRLQDVALAAFGPSHPDTLLVAARRGQIASGRGRDGEAAVWFAEAASALARSLGPDHLATLLAGAMEARALARAGRLDAAAAALSRVQLEAGRRLSDHGVRSADLHELWAETLLLVGRRDDAAVELAAFEASAVVMLPADHPRLAAAQCLASRIASERGEAERAGEALNRCRMGLARLSPEDHRRRLLAAAENALGGRPIIRRPSSS